uniref:Uncharacterized protein n=1 Tax=Onchocerca volvulus TaxID=6282 RepID=A0A8R1XKW6_ONCVO
MNLSKNRIMQCLIHIAQPCSYPTIFLLLNSDINSYCIMFHFVIWLTLLYTFSYACCLRILFIRVAFLVYIITSSIFSLVTYIACILLP